MPDIKLTWSGDILGVYEVQYKLVSSVDWISPSSSPVTGVTITLPDLEENTDYIFRVRSVCNNAISPWLYQTFKTPTITCDPVTNLAVTTTQTTAAVTWTASATAVNGYIVEWKPSANTSWMSSPIIFATSYPLSGLTAGTSYDIRITSICASGHTTTTGIQNFNTQPVPQICASVVVSALVVVDQASNYKANWSLAGSPQSWTFQYSIDGTNFYTLGSTIVSQTSTQLVYTLPPAYTTFPLSHYLKVIPKCSDNSVGTSATYHFTAPVVLTHYVTIQNAMTTGTINTFSVDGSPNVLTGNINPGSSVNFNEAGLINAVHNIAAMVSTPIGTTLKVEIIRGGSPIMSSNIIYNGNIPIASGFEVHDQDIFKISIAPVQIINGTVTVNCQGPNCYTAPHTNGGYLTFNFANTVPSSLSMGLGWCSEASDSTIALCRAVSWLGVTPVHPECNTTGGTPLCLDSLRYNFAIPAGVTTLTTPILVATDTIRPWQNNTQSILCPACTQSVGYKESIRHLYLKVLSPTMYQLNVTITNPDIVLHIVPS